MTDPTTNALLSHEIMGHPVELDRASRWRRYEGRSGCLQTSIAPLGRPVASPLVTAYPTPRSWLRALRVRPRWGTPARRVNHIEAGIFTASWNSRQTARLFGGVPNGHWKRPRHRLVPLVGCPPPSSRPVPATRRASWRRSTTGYYLVGHRHPVHRREPARTSGLGAGGYAIEGGQLGQALSERRTWRRLARLPDARRRRRRRLPSLPIPTAARGADADQAARQRGAHHAKPRP